ncbi:ATP binding protein [Aureococcus anophagefferens]|nr:ATP binding protein [Aureococcus anophagefferens]
MASRSSVVVAAVAAAVAWRVGQGVGGDEARPAPAPRRRGGWRLASPSPRRAYGAWRARKNVAACERDLAAFRESGVTTATLRDVVTYRAEQWWATTASGIPLTLLAASVGFVLAGSLAYAAATGDDWEDALFASWLFVADPAAHAGVTGAAATAVGFVMTVVGLVIFGFVVSVTSEVMGARVEALKLGNSAVVEQDHTLVLGYSENLRPLIAQVALERARRRRRRRAHGSHPHRGPHEGRRLLRVRRGAARENVATTATVALALVAAAGDLRRSAPTAKCVVVLADHDVGADESDAKVMRAVLALSAFPKLRATLVAEVRDADNAGERAAREPPPHRELLGFEGDEFYLRHWPALVGKTFRELVEGDLLEGAVAVGLRRSDGAIELDAVDATIREGDEVIVIAEDDDTYGLRDARAALGAESARGVARGRLVDAERADVQPRRVVRPAALPLPRLAQRHRGHGRLPRRGRAAGSQLTIAAPLPIRDRDEQMVADGRGRRGPLRRLSLRHVVDTVVSRAALERLPLDTCDAVLILSDQGTEDPHHADSLALATLVLVRDVQRRGPRHAAATTASPRGAGVVAVLTSRGRGRRASPGPGDGEPLEERVSSASRGSRGRRLDEPLEAQLSRSSTSSLANDRTPSLPLPGAGRGGACAVVTELRDISLQRNVRSSGLADCDFVASHELVARIVAMVSERAEYVAPGAIATFRDVAVAALDHGDVAIGTLLDGADLVLNPRDKISAPRAWSPDDSVAVIAAQPA